MLEIEAMRLGFPFTAERVVESSLISSVRETQTLNGGISVYQHANIELRTFDPKDVFPSALYVLYPNLKEVGNIATELRAEGKDIFTLTDIEQTSIGVIAPPVVELSDGVPTIVDGIHRFWWALSVNKPINAIYVENASLPIVSYPVSWDEVRLCDERPSEPRFMRKLRDGIADNSEDLRRYYRDLSFLGSKGRRPSIGQVA